MKNRTGLMFYRPWIGNACWFMALFLLAAAETAGAGDFTCTINADDTITITDYSGPGGDVTIPDTIEGKSVTKIGNWAFYWSSLTNVTIPDSVTNIGDNAFYFCFSLTNVTFGSGVTTIGDAAFKNCSSLTSVTIPDSVADIGDNAFYDCTRLTSVSIPNSVINIGNSTFYRCSCLTNVTLGAGVTNIGNYAFASSGLTSVTIPDSVASIGDSAFRYCYNMTLITVEAGNSVYSSMAGVLFDKSQTMLIQCPGGKAGSYTMPAGLASIGDYAFESCRRLTSVTIPDSVASIGAYAFHCAGLTNVAIPDSVTSIGSWTFDSCTCLANVTLGAGVTEIKSSMFAYCSSLTNVTFGAGVTNIGNSAFTSSGLTSVTIPDSVTSIGDYAFSGCMSLFSVTIPDSVTTIGNSVFHSCYGLIGVTLGTGITNIQTSAFFDCIRLTAITVDPRNLVYSSSVDGLLLNKSQTTLVAYPNGKAGSYTIPDNITSIGNSAFECCTSLTGVTIPDSVTNIGNNAFFGCYCLTNVTLGAGVTSIGDSAFASSGLTSITIPDNVTSIGEEAFAYCHNLISVTLGASVVSIGNSAFHCCTSLSSVVIPDNVTSIGDSAFSSCINLTSVTISDNVTSIGNWAFSSTRLTSVTIPPTLANINNGMFDSSSLTSITIPDSVTNIGSYGFSSCAYLTGVYFMGNAPSLGDSGVFTGDTNATVYYLTGTTGWGATFGGRPTVPWTGSATITSQPQSRTNGPGSSASFTVAATGIAPLYYQWQKNATDISLATNATYAIYSAATNDAGGYRCLVRNALGVATSAVATLTMSVVLVTSQPQSCTNNLWSSASFSVTASGTPPLYYQWQKNSMNINGATATNYTIASVAASHAGNYRCLVSNMLGAVTSAVATLTVGKYNQAITFPRIADQMATGAVALSAMASSGLPVSFSGNGPVTVSAGNVLSFSGAGPVSIVASQTGNSIWNAASNVTNTFNVNKANQIITFPAIPDQMVTSTVPLKATANSGLPVSFSVASGPGAISGGILSFTDTGIVAVAAGQAGNDIWNAAITITNRACVHGNESSTTNFAAPQHVLASDGVYTDKVEITWNAVEGANGYQVWRATANNSGAAALLGNTGGTSYDDNSSAVRSATMFYYWVKAWNSAATSEFSKADSGFCRMSTNKESISGQPVVGDYDGDHKADPAVYDLADGKLFVWLSSAGYARVTPVVTFQVAAGDLPVAGDFDGDGLADPGVFERASGAWYLWLSRSGYVRVGPVVFGSNADDIPVPADYDGDGTADPAVYQASSTSASSGQAGEWHVWLSGAGYVKAGPFTFQKSAEDIPVPGQFDSDCSADPAVYQQAGGAWYVWRSGAGYLPLGPVVFKTAEEHLAVPADYDGDGFCDPAAYVPSSGKWRMWMSESGYALTEMELQ